MKQFMNYRYFNIRAKVKKTVLFAVKNEIFSTNNYNT